MLSSYQTRFFHLFLIWILVFLIFGCTLLPTSQPPQVGDIIIRPDDDLTVGETATLSVEASGTNLKFEWAASRGIIEGEGSSVIYTAPKTSGPDPVTVEVTSAGRMVTRNLTIQVVTSTQVVQANGPTPPSPTPTPPSPTYTPTSPTLTNIPELSTDTPTASPTPTPISPPTDTLTPTPSETPIPTPTPTNTLAPIVGSFIYQVRVQDSSTGKYVSEAKVTIEVFEQAPLDGITDSHGLARIFIKSNQAGRPGFLIVEATGYKRYTQYIDLILDTLPKVVLLEPVQASQPSVTPIFTLTPTPTNIPSPTNTPTPQAEVIVPNLNLRSGPGTVYSRIGLLSSGEILDIKGRIASKEWIQVIPDGFDILGWVSAAPEFVKVNVDLNTIPTVIPPPTPTPSAPTPIPPTPMVTEPPKLIEPIDEDSRYNNRADLFWEWAGTLGPNDYFQVEIRNRFNVFYEFDESVPPIDVAWIKANLYKLDHIEEAYDREYKWRVIVVRGIPEGEKDWSTPDNQVWNPGKEFEFISQPSEMRTLYVEPGGRPVPEPGKKPTPPR